MEPVAVIIAGGEGRRFLPRLSREEAQRRAGEEAQGPRAAPQNGGQLLSDLARTFLGPLTDT